MREADHVPVARGLAVVALDLGYRAERLEHLGGGDVRGDLHGVGRRGERGRVNATVLSHLERQAVEAEGLELPAQILQLAVDDAVEADRGEPRRQSRRARGQLDRRCVAGSFAGPCAVQTLGHVREATPKRFVGKAAFLDLGQLRKVANVIG